jgi:hypothetical protein
MMDDGDWYRSSAVLGIMTSDLVSFRVSLYHEVHVTAHTARTGTVVYRIGTRGRMIG